MPFAPTFELQHLRTFPQTYHLSTLPSSPAQLKSSFLPAPCRTTKQLRPTHTIRESPTCLLTDMDMSLTPITLRVFAIPLPPVGTRPPRRTGPSSRGMDSSTISGKRQRCQLLQLHALTINQHRQPHESRRWHVSFPEADVADALRGSVRESGLP